PGTVWKREARYRCGCGGFGFSVPGGTAMTAEPHCLKNWSSGIAEVSFGSRGPLSQCTSYTMPPASVNVWNPESAIPTAYSACLSDSNRSLDSALGLFPSLTNRSTPTCTSIGWRLNAPVTTAGLFGPCPL